MKTAQILGVVLALSIPTVSYAQDATKPMAAMDMSSLTAKDYVAMAASSDMLEIASSKMALEKSKSENVRTFAQHMVNDHSATTSDIKTAAQAENITVPDDMMPKHADMLQTLLTAPADGFDAQYVELQVMAHQEAVALHSAYAQNGDDAALKAVATKAVPIVTEHLKDAQGLATKS